MFQSKLETLYYCENPMKHGEFYYKNIDHVFNSLKNITVSFNKNF